MLSLHARRSRRSIRARCVIRQSEPDEDGDGNQGGERDEPARPPAGAGAPSVHEREHAAAGEGLTLRPDKRLIIDHEPSNCGHAYLAIDWQSSLKLPSAAIPPPGGKKYRAHPAWAPSGSPGILTAMRDGGMYTRLADLRVPRPWWWWATLAFLLIRDGRRTRRQLEQIGRDLGESVVTRWEQADAATESMLKMTRTMVRLTWAVVVLTVVVIGATVYLGLR
jgi:hypothetical protein